MKIGDIQKMTDHLRRQGTPYDPQLNGLLLRQLGYDPAAVYQELEMSSRFVDTHRDASFPGSQVSLHSHSFYEILYCRNSCGVEYLLGSDRFVLQRGDIVIVPPGTSHCPLLPERMESPYKRYVLWLSVEYASALYRLFPGLKPAGETAAFLIRTAGTKWESLGAYFRGGIQEAEAAEPNWEAAVAGNTLVLLTQLQRAIQDPATAPGAIEHPELLDRILGYIEQHYPERITLEEIARHFWVSQSTISQTFRSKMGVSFYRCVTQRRLIAAKTLIGQGLALEEVGAGVGFSDYSTFYRAFKKEYGISPRQFKKLLAE